jgi:hypothetical protein
MTMDGVDPSPRVVLPFAEKAAKPRPPKGSEPSRVDERPSEPPTRSEPPAAASQRTPQKKAPAYNKELARTAKVGEKVPKITLPFRANQAGGSSRDSSTGPPEREERAAAEHRSDYNPDLGKTAALGENIESITLPFRAGRHAGAVKGRTDDRAPDPSAAPSSPPPAATPSSPPPSATPSSPPPGAEVRPARGPASDGDQVAGWQIKHYASLCAELAEHPERTEAIRARYGLADEAAEQYVHETFQMRFIEDDAARREWQRLLKQFRASLARNK